MSTLILEVLKAFTVKEGGRIVRREPGQRLRLTPDQAQRILDHVGDRVRLVDRPTTVDPAIGTVVQGPMAYQNGSGQPVLGIGPWVVLDVVHSSQELGVMPGRWFWLAHGSDRRFCHESTVKSYRCPNCHSSSCWWSEYTVLCVRCVSPTILRWAEFWRELEELKVGIAVDDPRYTNVHASIQDCDEAFKRGDYAGFQTGIIRARRSACVD